MVDQVREECRAEDKEAINKWLTADVRQRVSNEDERNAVKPCENRNE
jgi:hypothetical protein